MPARVLLLGLLLAARAGALDLVDTRQTVETLPAGDSALYGRSELHVTGRALPPARSRIDLHGEDAWLFLESWPPSEVVTIWLPRIRILGAPAALDGNVRVTPYGTGTVVIPHGPTFPALAAFTEPGWTGDRLEVAPYAYVTATEGLRVGRRNFDNALRSFRLRRGYMATFAQEADGTGYSRVYVAQDEDLLLRRLPRELEGQVSFVRVIPWRWTHKKGWAGGIQGAPAALACGWRYDWNNAATSTLDVEYVPMRHNRYWNAFNNINTKRGSTHVLGFNEPDRPDQADMTVEQAIALWPKLLASGLRLGSPAVSDGGRDWLYRFMDRCDELGYRVDFVAIHYYHGGRTAQQFRNWLRDVHERTGRPLWVTEWNNGATWTCCKPTLAQQADTIRAFVEMLDAAPFVERYAIYNWVGDTRKLIPGNDPSVLTPAGEIYRDNAAPLAYVSPPLPRPDELPTNDWTIAYVDSEETVAAGRIAEFAIDGDPRTFWHTEWKQRAPRPPHEIRIDLGARETLAGLRYLPRQDGNLNGTIARYAIYVSDDPERWGSAVATGTWAKNADEKEARFEAVAGAYLRLVALSEVNGGAWTSAAEVKLVLATTPSGGRR